MVRYVVQQSSLLVRIRVWNSVCRFVTCCFIFFKKTDFEYRHYHNLPLVGCPRLFVKQIRNYPSCLAADFLICCLRMCHALVTRNPLRLYLWLCVCHWSDFDSLNIQAGQTKCTVWHTFITFTVEHQSAVDNMYKREVKERRTTEEEVEGPISFWGSRNRKHT
jgi:hypothetical protein